VITGSTGSGSAPIGSPTQKNLAALDLELSDEDYAKLDSD
jgi:hypothetical protein